MFFFFFKQKTAYEILTCDWSSDVCSSDLNDWVEGVVCVTLLYSHNDAADGSVMRLRAPTTLVLL